MKCGSTILVRDKYGVLMRVPCGQCINCRLNRAKSWSIRIDHETRSWPSNIFLTLTYRDDALPADGSLSLQHMQNFMKNLRFYLKKPIRFYAAAEYSDWPACRPHYHYILFNVSMSDLPWKDFYKVKNGFRGEIKCWNKGLVHCGDVSPDSAGYVAGYVVKKLKGDMASLYGSRRPPFSVMSRSPGIGANYACDNSEMLQRNNFVISKGVKYGLPRQYMQYLKHKKANYKKSHDYHEKFKQEIQDRAERFKHTFWQEMEECENALVNLGNSKLKLLKRSKVDEII